MRRTSPIGVLGTLLIVLAGCTSAGGILGDTNEAAATPSAEVETPETTTPVPDCIRLDKGDPNTPKCLITERPADLRVENLDSADRVVSVLVVRNRSTVVLSETESFETGLSPRAVYEDVFDRPGTYNITATVGDTTTSATWNASERNFGTGGVEWEVHVLGSDDVTVGRIPRH